MDTTRHEDPISCTKHERWIDHRSLRSIRGTIAFTVIMTTLSFTSVTNALDAQGIASFKRQAAQKMCADGGVWLRCFSVDPLQCEPISAKLLDTCVSKEASLQPGAAVDPSQAAEISESLFSCVRSSFLAEHEKKKIDSDECSEVDS